ncbi:MAG: hypothetical protein QM765_08945 [Myxococcales bacterium]
MASKKTRVGLAVTTALGAGAITAAAVAGSEPKAAPAPQDEPTKVETQKADKSTSKKKVEKAKDAKRRPSDQSMEFSMPAGTAYDVLSRKDIA